MAPNSAQKAKTTITEHENEIGDETDTFPKLVAPQAAPRKHSIIYFNLLTFGYGHLAALYGIYLTCTIVTWSTVVFHIIIYLLAMIGVTAGVHRLWAHRAYKAKMALQILLMLMNTLAFQNSAIHWVREHRMHHRYTDTDADPHNSTRGFFFSHMGWLLVRKHPEIHRRGKFIDMSDIHANPVLRFQKKYAIPFIGTIAFVMPTLIPMYLFGETLNTAWHLTVLRYLCNLHSTFLVNSAAHLWGTKPYDKSIKPTQILPVSMVTFGEGFHNYHHTYPWDYRTAELGNNWLNLTTVFIDMCAWLGLAYDLKEVPQKVIDARVAKSGDGNDTWGFGYQVKGE